jgi:hypothetical protein
MYRLLLACALERPYRRMRSLVILAGYMAMMSKKSHSIFLVQMGGKNDD